MDELLKKIQGGFNAYAEMGQPITEEDKNQSANNMRNALIQLAGLPENWKMSKADEKQHFQNLPEMMGMATMGSVNKLPVNKTVTTAEQLLQAPASKYDKLIMGDGGPTKINYGDKYRGQSDYYKKLGLLKK